MAHSCPDCGQACYCGGDIDDIFFEDSEEEMGCTHCEGADFVEHEEFDDLDYSNEPGGAGDATN